MIATTRNTTLWERFVGICGGSRCLAWLILANVALFLLVRLLPFVAEAAGFGGYSLMELLSLPSDPGNLPARPWTVLTYMFTQHAFLHLLFNVVWLYWFGIVSLGSFPGFRLLRIYLGGGIAGAFAYIAAGLLEAPGAIAAHSYLCGSSAAVLSVMAATATFAPQREISLFLIGRVRIVWVCLLCAALAFIGSGDGSYAARFAHGGGLAFGIAYALFAKQCGFARMANTIRRKCKTPPRKVRDARAVTRSLEVRFPDADRLDSLLDKIRVSGYSSLSAGERNELNVISRRLEKKDKP